MNPLETRASPRQPGATGEDEDTDADQATKSLLISKPPEQERKQCSVYAPWGCLMPLFIHNDYMLNNH